VNCTLLVKFYYTPGSGKLCRVI